MRCSTIGASPSARRSLVRTTRVCGASGCAGNALLTGPTTRTGPCSPEVTTSPTPLHDAHLGDFLCPHPGGAPMPQPRRAPRPRGTLRHIGYYRLSPYTIPFQKAGPEHRLRDGTSFDDVLDLYVFDRALRLVVMDALERIEVAVRATRGSEGRRTPARTPWSTAPPSAWQLLCSSPVCRPTSASATYARIEAKASPLRPALPPSGFPRPPLADGAKVAGAVHEVFAHDRG